MPSETKQARAPLSPRMKASSSRCSFALIGTRDQPGVPAGVEQLQVLRAVLEHEPHAVARAEPQGLDERAGQSRRACGKARVVEHHLAA